MGVKLAQPRAIATGPWSAATAEAIQQNFERLYGSSGRIGGGGATFTNGLDTLDPLPGSLIVCTASGVFALLPIDASDQRSLTNNGGTPTWALVDVSKGITGRMPFANLIAATATQRVVGRNTAGTGSFEEVTLSQLLDWVGAAAQGDILYRNATTWVRLPAGTAGQFLQTAGNTANPVWAGISSTNLPLATTSHLEYTVDISGSMKSNRGLVGSPSGTITNAYKAAGSILASGQYAQFGTSASTNSTATLNSGTSASTQTAELSWIWDFDLTFIMRTDASAVTTVRYMFGVGTSNPDTDNVTTNHIGIRFSTSAGDTTWVGITSDGTQAVTAAISAAVAADTRYVLRIRKVGGTVFFSVNGGTEVSTSAHVPANNVYANICARVTALANVVRSFWFARLWVDYGT